MRNVFDDWEHGYSRKSPDLKDVIAEVSFRAEPFESKRASSAGFLLDFCRVCDRARGAIGGEGGGDQTVAEKKFSMLMSGAAVINCPCDGGLCVARCLQSLLVGPNPE